MGQSLLHRGACFIKKTALLQTGTSITNWGKGYYKVGQVIQYSASIIIAKYGRYYEYGNFIVKWGNYYRKDQYTFVTLGEIETHVY